MKHVCAQLNANPGPLTTAKHCVFGLCVHAPMHVHIFLPNLESN